MTGRVGCDGGGSACGVGVGVGVGMCVCMCVCVFCLCARTSRGGFGVMVVCMDLYSISSPVAMLRSLLYCLGDGHVEHVPLHCQLHSGIGFFYYRS